MQLDNILLKNKMEAGGAGDLCLWSNTQEAGWGRQTTELKIILGVLGWPGLHREKDRYE